MKKVLSALFALALCSGIAAANVPVPENCDVDPADALNGVILGPDSPAPIPASVYTVVLRNIDNQPISGAPVVFEFSAGGLVFCTTAQNSGVTNNQGTAVITLRGGGCKDNQAGAVTVKGNGVPIRNYNNAKSPDWNGVNGDGDVDLQDLVSFRSGITCHDYDNANGVGLPDLVIFVSGYVPTHTCTL
jgi:hypothetical protein